MNRAIRPPVPETEFRILEPDITRKSSVKDRAYLTGFTLGYYLGRQEAMKELRSIGNEFEAEFEAFERSSASRSQQDGRRVS